MGNTNNKSSKNFDRKYVLEEASTGKKLLTLQELTIDGKCALEISSAAKDGVPLCLVTGGTIGYDGSINYDHFEIISPLLVGSGNVRGNWLDGISFCDSLITMSERDHFGRNKESYRVKIDDNSGCSDEENDDNNNTDALFLALALAMDDINHESWKRQQRASLLDTAAPFPL